MDEKRPYCRTGLNALKAKVKVRGLHALDTRTAGAQALLAWRKELFDHLGGEATCGPDKRALVEMAVRTRLYVENVDSWLLGQQTLVSMKHRSVLPVLRERMALADSLARYLAQIGVPKVEPSGISPDQIHALLSGGAKK